MLLLLYLWMVVRAAAHRPPMDSRQAAEYLGITERWLRRARAERRVPFVKMGKFVRYRPDDLDEWLDRQKIDDLAEPRPGAGAASHVVSRRPRPGRMTRPKAL
jgi:excisionase family DNA binding protein